MSCGISSTTDPFGHTVLSPCGADACAVSTKCRVQALKALCEMRLDRDDCRGAIEAAAAPKRRRKGEPDDDGPNIEAFRASPLGTDAAGRTYWYHNFYETTGAGTDACCRSRYECSVKTRR